MEQENSNREYYGIEYYADYTTPFTYAPNTDTLISKSQFTVHKLFTWFKNSNTKVNTEKYHLLLSSKIRAESLLGGYSFKLSTKETLLGASFDSELRFDEHISFTCTKTSRKINALGRIANFMSHVKRRLIMKDFIELIVTVQLLPFDIDAPFPNLIQ